MQTALLKTFDKATGRTKPGRDRLMGLFRSIGADDLPAVQKFIDRYGIQHAIDDIDGRTALMRAAGNGKAEIVSYLLTQGSPVNAAMKDGNTAFGRAIENNHIDCARILMQAGADIDPRDRTCDWRLLHTTIGFDRYDSFLFLLAQGVEIDSPNENGVTPLMHAVRCHRNDARYIEKLLAAGANMDLRDADGRSAYTDAQHLGLTDIVTLMQKQRKENMRAVAMAPVKVLKPLRIKQAATP